MEPMDTVAIMVGLFLVMGCVIPTILIMRGKVDNRIMLWMTMAFTIVLIFGVIADFTSLDTSVRMLIIEYGFVLTMVFGVIFGIDLLLQGNYISRVRWKDLDIDTSKVVKGAVKAEAKPKVSEPELETEPNPEETEETDK